MKKYKEVHQTSHNRRNNVCCDEMTVVNKYEEIRSEIVPIFGGFADMYNGHKARITTTNKLDTVFSQCAAPRIVLY